MIRIISGKRGVMENYQFRKWRQCINNEIESAISATWIVCIHALYPKSINNYCTQTKDHNNDDTLKQVDPVITTVHVVNMTRYYMSSLIK